MTGNNLADKFVTKFNSAEDKLQIKKKSGKKHRSYEVYYSGEKVVPLVMFSHGSEELRNKVIGYISRQLGLKSKQVKGIYNCDFFGKDFVLESSKVKE